MAGKATTDMSEPKVCIACGGVISPGDKSCADCGCLVDEETTDLAEVLPTRRDLGLPPLHRNDRAELKRLYALAEGHDLMAAVEIATLLQSRAADPKSRSHQRAVRFLKWAAERGSKDAMAELGAFHAEIKGTAADHNEGARWLLAAGNSLTRPRHMYLLGRCYENGLGIAQSDELALKWYVKAADAGEAAAQERVGKACLLGLFGAVDVVNARKWFELAAEQGNEAAQLQLEKLEDNVYDEAPPEADEPELEPEREVRRPERPKRGRRPAPVPDERPGRSCWTAGGLAFVACVLFKACS